MSELPCTFLCVHGNHEARPTTIPTYRQTIWHGGVVFYEEDFPRLFFAKDGEIFDFDRAKAIVLGGAYSVDKEYRLTMGYLWFPDEQPDEQMKHAAEQKLEEAGWSVDYVFSHTCPQSYVPTDLFLDFIDQSKVDHSTEHWLNKLKERMQYKRWYFGHYHENREYPDATMLYEEIQELGKSGFLQRIGRPKYKRGDMVLFTISSDSEEFECYGRVRIVDECGSFVQTREASYDVEGPDYRDSARKMLYKHIPESDLQSMNELQDSLENH